MTLVARAITRPGDVVACESPSFAGVLRAIRSAGAQVLGVPVDDDGLDIDALEQLLARHEIRMLALQPRIQNPTGRDLSPERRERLVELAAATASSSSRTRSTRRFASRATTPAPCGRWRPTT